MGALAPSDRMAKRDRLGDLLATAAELEHSVVCQYLYVAFSMKRHPDEGGVSWAQLEPMRRLEADILLIARQEMEHLGLVANLLTAIGEAPHFLRPDFPVPSNYFPMYDPPSLEGFGHAALQRLVRLERPACTRRLQGCSWSSTAPSCSSARRPRSATRWRSCPCRSAA